jgi:hypothetical protein
LPSSSCGSCAALAFSASAYAASPHFISGSATINQNGSLSCSFKIAGLGNEPQDVTCTATGTFVYQCFNNGGNHPKAGNKETVSGQFSTTQQFQPHNGQITGGLLLGPAGACRRLDQCDIGVSAGRWRRLDIRVVPVVACTRLR